MSKWKKFCKGIYTIVMNDMVYTATYNDRIQAYRIANGTNVIGHATTLVNALHIIQPH